jgi:hypothetical protein
LSKRRFITLSFFILLLVLAYASPVLADYLGPNRTVTVTTTDCDVTLWSCEWVEAKGTWKYKQSDFWSCQNESKPWQKYPSSELTCNASHNGYEYWDKSDSESTSTVTYPPATVSGALQDCTLYNGWCNTVPTLGLIASEPVAGYSITNIEGTRNGVTFTCPPGTNCNQSLGQGNNTFSYWAHSTFGDTSVSSTLSAKVDTLAPTVDAGISGTPGTNGWYVSNVTVSPGAADATSGVANAQVSINGGDWQANAMLTDGTYTLSSRAIDNAGNTVMKLDTIKVDTIAPSVIPVLPAVDGSNGWVKTGPAVVSADGADSGSGLASAQVSMDEGPCQSALSLPDGIHTVKFKTTDNAGNSSTATKIIKVDATAPSLAFVNEGTPGNGDWYVSPVTTSILSSDDASGMDSIQYNQNEAGWEDGSSFQSRDGINRINVRVSDAAGNVSVDTLQVKVDTVAPAASFSISGTRGTAGWYISTTTTSFLPDDQTSGVDHVEYSQNGQGWQTGASVESQDGINSISMRVYDRAGNVSADTLQVKIDTGKPSSAFVSPVNGSGNNLARGVFSMSGSSWDAVSGVSTAELSFDGGLSWMPLALQDGKWAYDLHTDSLADGVYRAAVRTTDRAGNVDGLLTSTAYIYIIVNNDPPHIKLSPEWFIWQSGSLSIHSGYFPLKSGTVTISDPQNRWPKVEIPFDENYPASIKWDRRFANGILAPSGNYDVMVTACNSHNLCSNKTAVIQVPWVAVIIPTSAPTTPSSMNPEQPVAKNVPTRAPAAPVNPLDSPRTTLPRQHNTAGHRPVLGVQTAFPLVILVALLSAVASASLSDTRPAAIAALAKTISQQQVQPTQSIKE